MKPIYIFVFSALLPCAALAQAGTDGTATGQAAATAALDGAAGPVAAGDIVLDDLKFIRRPVVVFADSPEDPSFVRQMELINMGLPALAERDVLVITDTDPDARSELRKKLRPRGFSLVLMDKDQRGVLRKPLPWDVREIVNAIDKFPLRRQEIQQRDSATD